MTDTANEFAAFMRPLLAPFHELEPEEATVGSTAEDLMQAIANDKENQ